MRPTAISIALIALAACSGGGIHTTPLPSVATAQPTTTATFTLTVPTRAAASKTRRAQYVSASTQAVLFTVTPGNYRTKINLTAGNCTTTPAGTAQVCTLAVAAPIGIDTVAMTAFDQPFNVDGTLPGSAKALSAASNFTVTITEGQANVSYPLISGGIPSTLSIAIGGGTSTTLTGGSASTSAMTVTVYDADNNIIVGPGSYVDASGNAAPITITSSQATTGFGYAVTPSGSTVAGATSATITLNEPGDSVAVAYNGSVYVPTTDTLMHTIPSHVGGATTTQLGFGWRFTPPFSPQLLLAPPASISSTIGHKGIVIADRTNHLGFVGDITRSCSVGSIGAGSVTRIGGITFNAGETDTNVYLWVTDSAEPNGEGLDGVPLSEVFSNSCPVGNFAAGQTASPTTLGIAAAGNNVMALTTSGTDYIESFTLPSFVNVGFNIIDGSSSFGTQAVGIAPSGASTYVQFGAKKRIDYLAFSQTTATAQFSLAGLVDPTYPGGLDIDTSGNVYANDTTTATYGSNGGIDVFSSTLARTNQVFLGSPLQQTGPQGALQNIAVGPYGTSSAIYAVTAAGIEVFAFPLAASVATPTETITVPSTPVSIVTVADGREWVLLNDGTIDALPPN